VRTTLSVESAALRLEIVDDGCGFASGEATAGRGLPGMRSRAAELGGQCAIETAVGAGTRVRVVLPLPS
jgi:signal transduction histidine kinase